MLGINTTVKLNLLRQFELEEQVQPGAQQGSIAVSLLIFMLQGVWQWLKGLKRKINVHRP